MKQTPLEFVQMLCPDLSPTESVNALRRLDTFVDFIVMVRRWRNSLPPQRRAIPPRYKNCAKPFCLDDVAANAQ